MRGAYPKILHVGDKQIADLFDGDVEITEKLDGSQFGFGKQNGELVCRSKGKIQELDNPDKMFLEGVEYVKSIAEKIPDNTFFYGEYFQKPRHSTLAYDRIPKNHIALFGILFEDNTMGAYGDIEEYAERFGVEAIPHIYTGKSTPEEILKMVERVSALGGQNVEGVVVKRYEPWMFLGQILTPVKAGKYVTEKFKEVHEKDWSNLNTGKGQFEVMKGKYRSEARWTKAIQHLKENGDFDGSVKDIGKLIKEIQRDLAEEEIENIKTDLYRIFGDEVKKFATKGFVDWYKEKIVLGEFQDESTDQSSSGE